MKRPTTLKDALYIVRRDSGASDAYSRGLVVGVVAALIAETDCSYESAIRVVTDHLPVRFDPKRLPEAFRDGIVEECERRANARRNGYRG